MNVKDIGYKDSFLWLPSALEAQALSATGLEETRNKRWTYLADAIKDAAATGNTSVHTYLSIEPALALEEEKLLLSLGYTLKSSLNGLREISWNHSSSSETTPNTKDTVSSSEEIVASVDAPPASVLD